MKKMSVLFPLFCMCVCLATAQNFTRNDVVSVKVRNAGAITQNGQVKGYYYFYNLEKKDRKNNNYMLTVTDENLREINSVDVTRPNSYLLIDAVFNGESFGFLFYDVKEGAVELMGYDKSLKPTNVVNKKLDNKYANSPYLMIAQGGMQAMQSYLVAVPDKGFIYYGVDSGPKAEHEIEFYDNNMKQAWRSVGPRDDEFDFETPAEGFQDKTYVGSVVGTRTGALSMDILYDLLVHKIDDGNLVFRIPLGTSKYNYSPSEIFFDEKKKQFVFFGEYYNKGEKIIKAESQGFISMSIDMKGKVLAETVTSWEDVKKKVEAKDLADFEKKDIMFHEFLRTADGQTFAIGELYKRTGTRLDVYNMVIFQFNNDFSIGKVSAFAKDRNSVPLPPGLLVYNAKIVSWYAKAFGAFDYVFSQVPDNRQTFMVSYINYDREKGQKGKNVLGTIIYTPEKSFVTDNLPLSRKSSTYFVYRAKPGYVMVSEYFEKEKKLDSRLEKINY